MSPLLFGLRATALSAAALVYAAGCGSTGTATSSSSKCFIYVGAGKDIPPPPDGASLCPKAGSCNYQTQSGCPATETCFPHYDETSKSVVATCGVAGTQKTGQPCDSAAKLCAKGLICADSVCAKPCCGGDYTACDPGQSCIRQAVAFKTASGDIVSFDEGLGTCAPVGNCELLDPGACTTDPKRPVCRIVDPTGAIACAPTGDRTLGDDCDETHQCGPGQTCAGNSDSDATAQTKCVRLCKFGDCRSEPSCPAAEGTCVHFINRDPDGVGECTPNWPGQGVAVDGGAPVTIDAGSVDASAGH